MAFDTYMIVPGAPGESLVTNLKDIRGRTVTQVPFEVFAFSFGVSDQVTIGSGSGGGTAGKPTLSTFNITRKSDKASLPLFRSSLTGKFLASAQVLMVRAGSSALTIAQYDMTNVFVESMQWSGSSGGDDTPTESVSFTPVIFRYRYVVQNADGSPGPVQTLVYDQSKNTVGP